MDLSNKIVREYLCFKRVQGFYSFIKTVYVDKKLIDKGIVQPSYYSFNFAYYTDNLVSLHRDYLRVTIKNFQTL